MWYNDTDEKYFQKRINASTDQLDILITSNLPLFFLGTKHWTKQWSLRLQSLNEPTTTRHATISSSLLPVTSEFRGWWNRKSWIEMGSSRARDYG